MIAEQVAPTWQPAQFVDVLLAQRMRTEADRDALAALVHAELAAGDGEMIEQAAPYLAPLQPEVHVTRRHVQVGHAWFERSIRRMPAPEHLEILPSQLRPLQALMTCVRMRWMAVVSGGASSSAWPS